MPRDEKEALSKVYRHFLYSDNNNDDSDVESPEEARPSRRRLGSSRKRQRRVSPEAPEPFDPWRRFLKLETLSLVQCARPYISRPGPAAAAMFLEDKAGLEHLGLEDSRGSTADAFVASHKYTRELQNRGTNDNVRWCFSMMHYYDLVILLYPEQSGKIGTLMLQEIHELLGPSLSDILCPRSALRDLNEWSLQGKKVNDLCEVFGVGCLFFLGDTISRDL